MAQVSLIIINSTGLAPFPRLSAPPHSSQLVSIYGLNETDSAFLTQISKTLLEEIDCPLVVGGDFNAVINPALDKSQSDTTANPSSKLLNKFITELNLINLWRIQNTKAKDFTFFF